MGISPKTHKMLWGHAANRCAFPDCRLELMMDVSETDDPSLVGEECRIVARELKGPRERFATCLNDIPVSSKAKASIYYLKQKGWSNVQVAEFTGHHRDTIARVLKEEVDQKPKKRERKSAVSVFDPQIQEWLD